MTPTGGRTRTLSETNTAIIGLTTPLTNDDCHDVTIHDDNNPDSGRLPDVVAESKFYGIDEPIESYLAITIQVSIPFLVAGLGMVGAGLVLDAVQVIYPSLLLMFIIIYLFFKQNECINFV